MKNRILIAALTFAIVPSLYAQTPVTTQARVTECIPQTRTGSAARTPGQPSAVGREYDVVLEVPNLCVRRIQLGVRNLEAHVALNALVANLVRVQAGADVAIKSVDLTLQGVRAEALVLVDLDNVYYIADRALQLIDNNPQIFAQLYRTAGRAVGTVGGLANTAVQPGGVVSQTVGVVGRTLENVTLPGGLLSQTVNTLGQTVVRTLDTTGRIVERTVDTAGKIVGENAVGSVASLQLVRETAGAAGQMVRQVRDTTGALIEYTVNAAGQISNARVVQAATGR